MTPPPPEQRSAAELVRRAGSRLRASAVLVRLAVWLAGCLGLGLAMLVLDNLLKLPAGLRFPLAVAGLAAAGGLGLRLARACRRPAPEAVAVQLERRFQVRFNLLINALEFEAGGLRPGEQALAEKTMAQCRQAAPAVRLGELWERRCLARWGGGAAALLLLWSAYVALFPRYAVNAAWRYLQPMADRPPIGAVGLAVQPDADVTVREGEDLTVTARIEPPGSSAADAGPEAPQVVWRQGGGEVDMASAQADRADMQPLRQEAGGFTYTFARVARPFAFRVAAADTYSRRIQVSVRPRPVLRESRADLEWPAYTGRKPERRPGPPATVAALPDSRVRLTLKVRPEAVSVSGQAGGEPVPFRREGDAWSAGLVLTAAVPFTVSAREPGCTGDDVVARGALALEPDLPPEVAFAPADLSRPVMPGATLRLTVTAKDDYGLRLIQVAVRDPAPDSPPPRKLKEWVYLGPPGSVGPVRESFDLDIRSDWFEPRRAYLLEARAFDFSPGGQPGVSRALALRIGAPESASLPPGDPLTAAFDRLKAALAQQQKALGLTANLILHLDEEKPAAQWDVHRKPMRSEQESANRAGAGALGLFRKTPDGALYSGTLASLVEGEMPWVLKDMEALDAGAPEGRWNDALAGIRRRQEHIVAGLLALLGRLLEERRSGPPEAAQTAPVSADSRLAPDARGLQLKEDLKTFIHDQARVLNQARTLSDKGPEDLTLEDQQILGELAREEAVWAKLFEEKLTDFSKLPLQDFADGSAAEELNEVYQEVQLAAAEFYARKIELAVPAAQSGLESAEELLHNLERWMPDTPDHLKWVMEDAPVPADVPLAELPAELEDITGELLDREEDMGEDVEDVTSAWMDSLDKGAGWDALDGPISSMSARGITGNQLPNQQEIGGRAGEGRTGRSHGQMVEDSAVGKDGRQTPSRLTPSPFEAGSVKDSSKADPGGATGGGRLSGYSAEGLRGPAPDRAAQALPRLQSNQARLRQEAETLALKLRAFHLPTGDLESSIRAMQALEDGLDRRDGPGVRQAYSQALDALSDAGRAIRTEAGVRRERNRLPPWMREEIMAGYREGIPRGFEDLVAAYFRALAEEPALAPVARQP